MSEKKGILSGLFGKKEKSGCCNMQIVEEKEALCCGQGDTSACGCAQESSEPQKGCCGSKE